MNQKIAVGGLITLALLLFVFAPNVGVNLGGSNPGNSNQATTTSATVGTTSTLVGYVMGEVWACTDGPSDAWLGFSYSASTSTGNSGFRISSSTGCSGPFYYSGAVNAATKAGTAAVSLTTFKK